MVGNQVIQQGHKCRLPAVEADLIAVRQWRGMWVLREIQGEWLGAEHYAFPEDAEPVPMKYFQGQIPNGGA